MPSNNDAATDLDPELASLSLENVLSALECEDGPVFAAVSRCIVRYAELAGLELQAGRDYLPLLTPGENTPPLAAVAMNIVLETVEEELEDKLEEEGGG
ncbi:MAG: hypothetical protein LBO77_01005 [Desulfovibrio sp.]|jgi:hypothetical protein|nr:hypothetical protein [Desulfovibrio sp.]